MIDAPSIKSVFIYTKAVDVKGAWPDADLNDKMVVLGNGQFLVRVDLVDPVWVLVRSNDDLTRPNLKSRTLVACRAIVQESGAK